MKDTLRVHMPTPADVPWDDVSNMPRDDSPMAVAMLEAWIAHHLSVCAQCREYVAEGY